MSANSGGSNIQFSLINLHQRSTGCPAAAARVYHPQLRALRATTMSPACASMAPLQYLFIRNHSSKNPLVDMTMQF